MPDRPPVRPLVGREPEREILNQALRDARGRMPRVVVVAGEAGVGKTTLVERFAADASSSGDLLVMSGAGIAFGSEGLPFAPIIGALRHLVHDIGTEAVTSLLPVSSGLAPLIPELGPTGGARTVQRAAGQEALVLPVVIALLERLSSDRTVLLVIEDLHWVDQSTATLLDLLARTVRNARLLTVVTYRSDGLPRGHRMRSFLSELERIRGVSRIELGPLSRAETAELVSMRAGGGPPSYVTLNRIFDRSGGNPLFVEELVDAGEARLGETLRDLLLTRVDALPRSARSLVRLAAVAGRQVPHRLLAAIADLPEPALLEQLEIAVDGQILVSDGDGYMFRHALLWEAVAGSLLPGERMRLHRAYATALEREPAILAPEQVAAAVAHHWYAAREPGKALPAMLTAATVAGTIHAYAEQHQMLMRALELRSQVPDPDVARSKLLAEAARAATRAGELEIALDLVDRALAEREPEADVILRASLLEHRTRLLLHLGRDGAHVAAKAAERYAPAGSEVRISALDALAAAMLRDDTAAGARETAAEAVTLAERLGDVAKEIAARITLAQTLARLGRFEDVVRELRRAQLLAEQAGHQAGLARIDLNLTATLWTLGRLDEAIASALAGREVAAEAGLAHTLGGHIAAFGALSLLAQGRWDDALALLDSALQLDLPGLFAAFPLLVRGDIAVRRGDLAVASRLLADARAALGGDDAQGGMPLALLRMEIALHEDRLDEARLAARTALHADRARGDNSYAWMLVTTAARVETYARLRNVAFGEADDRQLIDELRQTAGRLPMDAPPWRAWAAQFDAELEHDRDQPADVAAAWREVVAKWEIAGDPYYASYARLRAAEAMVRAGARADAAVMLAAVVHEARRLGASRLQREVEALARRERLALDDAVATGTEAGPEHPLDRLGLTPREAQVLHLITAGRSNRQIATELVISEKTASVHVSRILHKLNVTSRGQAAATAHRLRLFEEDRPTA